MIVKTEYLTDLGMVKDNKTGLPFKPAVLRDRDGDLKKPWYVEFYAFDEKSGQLLRKRVSISMNFRDKKSRTAEGNRLIAIANDLLKKGYYFAKEGITTQPGKSPKEELIIKALQFSLEASAPALGEKTVSTYQSAINKFKAYPPAAGMPIAQFETRHAILFRDYLLTELKNSARTANNTIHHLQVVFAKYQERTGIVENPFKFKSLRQAATERNIAFSDEDRAKVEDYLMKHEPGVYFFTRMMYFAFIRPGELLKIQARHVHMKERYITVHGLISKNGKTETAQIIPALAHELQNRVNFQRPEQYLFSANMEPGQYPLSKQVPFRRHEKALRELGLLDKGYTLYSWKHTGAVNAYRAGVGIKELQSMLRHSSIQITDIYLKSLGLRTDPNLKNYSW